MSKYDYYRFKHAKEGFQTEVKNCYTPLFLTQERYELQYAIVTSEY